MTSSSTQRRKGAKAQRAGDLTDDDISRFVVDGAIGVHRTLGGPGLLESVYEEALAYELASNGLTISRQAALPIVYKGKRLATDLRLDLLVDGRVIVECKATTAFNPVFEAQVLTYLRLLELKLGLVINFGERLVKDGIHRVVNGL
jgi:GxxExxY protein